MLIWAEQEKGFIYISSLSNFLLSIALCYILTSEAFMMAKIPVGQKQHSVTKMALAK